MSIKGGSSNSRRHARNYTGAQADLRLKEVIGAVQQQSSNALMVDSFEIKYYQQQKSTTICTCKQTTVSSAIAARIIEPSSNVPVNMVREDSVLGKSIKIDYNRPLFGTAPEMEQKDEESDDEDFGPLGDDMEFDDEDDDDNQHRPTTTVDSTFSSGKDCGICYKTGFVPGYMAYGFERTLLTPMNIVDVYGYTTDMTTAPHTIRKMDERDGYVDFELHVPFYFNSANVSVRDNISVLSNELLYLAQDERVVLSMMELKASAGKTIRVRCFASAFTHVVVEFDLGTEKLRANLAQMSKTVDWTLFDTLGNIQMVLPPTIQNIAGNDIIYVPARAMTFKVTDVTYMRTAGERNLDWPVSTRVLQPQESLGRIHKANKVF